MIKGAIFDFDGTLVDSMFIWDTFGEDYLRTLGKEPKENLTEIFKTFTLEQAAEYYREHYGITLSAKQIVDGVNEMVARRYKTEVALKAGVREFLDALRSRGVKMCVATVTERSIAEKVLIRLGIRDFFEGILTCKDIGSNKETPHIYRASLDVLGTKKEETLVFEDALHALITAKKDHFKTVAVYDPHEKKQAQMRAFSDYYLLDYLKFNAKPTMKTALSIAGSDSSGGAGIQADIKTMTMNGVYAMSAITAMTAQNTVGVRSVAESTPSFLKEQIDSVFEDIYPNAVKIGMVSSPELIEVIAERLSYYKAENIVVDPVMVATSGSELMKSDAVKVLMHKLFPMATLVTPNIPESEVLSNRKISTKEDMAEAAKYIGDAFGCAVLIKGGHRIHDANDLLYSDGRFQWFCSKRIDNPNTHGTGCTLSSAIAANLAKGYAIEASIQRAKEYLSGALAAMLDLGSQSGPIDHAYTLSKALEEEESILTQFR